MNKTKAIYFILGGVIVGPLLMIILMSMRGASDKPSADYLAVESETKGVQCPDGAQMEYARWGQSGWIAKCKLAHGPFVAAENGHIAIKGEFALGKQVGETKVFDASGKVVKTERAQQK